MSKSKMASPISYNNFVKNSIINGNVKSKTDTRVDGKIVGNLDCEGRVVVGNNGSVLGNIICKSAMIEGKVEGNITVLEVLDIRATAKIFGDVEMSKLIIEEGSFLQGYCKMKA